MSEPLPYPIYELCPICRQAPETEEGYAFCDNEQCGLFGHPILIEKWNQRVKPKQSGNRELVEAQFPGQRSALLSMAEMQRDAEKELATLPTTRKCLWDSKSTAAYGLTAEIQILHRCIKRLQSERKRCAESLADGKDVGAPRGALPHAENHGAPSTSSQQPPPSPAGQ